MFQRKSASSSLPTTSIPNGGNDHRHFGLPGFGGDNKGNPSMVDGSGRGIKMDAPVVKAWKQASSFTKYSYYFVIFFLLMVYGGFRSLMYWNGTSRINYLRWNHENNQCFHSSSYVVVAFVSGNLSHALLRIVFLLAHFVFLLFFV
jgi:hypothetical protein